MESVDPSVIVNASRIPPAPPVLGDRPRWYEESVDALGYWSLVAGLWSEGSLEGLLEVPWGRLGILGGPLGICWDPLKVPWGPLFGSFSPLGGP